MYVDKAKTNRLIGELIGASVQAATGVDARELFRELGRQLIPDGIVIKWLRQFAQRVSSRP